MSNQEKTNKQDAAMQYRKLPHGDEKISIIGFGTSGIGDAAPEEMEKTFQKAIENGINYFDLAGGKGSFFPVLGKVIEPVRDKVYLQLHFGADYHTGEYGWTTDLRRIKEQVAWMLHALRTDYIDFGFIHCLDEEADLQAVMDHGVIDYLKELKEKGIVRHLGLSTHTPELAHKIMDLGLIDMLMFSINPAYDSRHGEYARGHTDERMDLYCRAEKEGVAISVMKPFSAGQLLDPNASPYHQALTKAQCIQYALDKPGVITVLPGICNTEDLDGVLEYLSADEAEKDYSALASFQPTDQKQRCVYCRHCHPCPAGLDIALINKYYDLAKMGDALAVSHYLNLEKKAEDCLHCGHCDHRCPFQTEPMERMDKIKDYFTQFAG